MYIVCIDEVRCKTRTQKRTAASAVSQQVNQKNLETNEHFLDVVYDLLLRAHLLKAALSEWIMRAFERTIFEREFASPGEEGRTGQEIFYLIGIMIGPSTK